LTISGAGGNRTRVQTYSPKAFYMLSSLLGGRQKTGNEQTNSLPSCMSLLPRSQPFATAFCFVFKSAAERGNRTTCTRGPND